MPEAAEVYQACRGCSGKGPASGWKWTDEQKKAIRMCQQCHGEGLVKTRVLVQGDQDSLKNPRPLSPKVMRLAQQAQRRRR